MTSQTLRQSIPLVRLSLASPFFDAATASGANVSKLLATLGLTTSAFSDTERLVPAQTIYAVVEALADATDDPHISVKLGTLLDPFSWSPLREAAITSQSIGEFLLRFSRDAGKDASSATYKMVTEGLRAEFSEVRKTKPAAPPRHNDGFSAAYVLSTLIRAVGDHFDGKQVIINVTDPDVFPPGYRGVRLARSGGEGFKIGFPSEWLLLKTNIDKYGQEISTQGGAAVPVDQMEALKTVITSNIDDKHLTTERIAKLCGVSTRSLVRQLSQQGSSVKREVDLLRRNRAEFLLANSALGIEEIGRAVGYTDSSAFVRAFRRWTSVTPGRFRKSGGTKRESLT